MELGEKFINIIYSNQKASELKKQCVVLSEEFAIGFAEWLANSYYSYNFGIKMFQHRNKEIYKTTKELLEIYKSELAKSDQSAK